VWSGNGLRVSVSKTLVLKMRSDRVVSERAHEQNHNFDRRKPAFDGQRNPGNDLYYTETLAHFRNAGYVSRMDVSHELSDRHLQQRLDACNLLEKNKETFFEENDYRERNIDCLP